MQKQEPKHLVRRKASELIKQRRMSSTVATSTTQSTSENGAKSAVTYAAVEVCNMAGELVFSMTAAAAEAAKIDTIGALRQHVPFRKSFDRE